MKATSVGKVLEWCKTGKVNISLEDLFRTAYYHKYEVLDERLNWCYANYLETGEVPSFVKEFILNHFIVGEEHETQGASERNTAPEVRDMWENWAGVWLRAWW